MTHLKWVNTEKGKVFPLITSYVQYENKEVGVQLEAVLILGPRRQVIDEIRSPAALAWAKEPLVPIGKVTGQASEVASGGVAYNIPAPDEKRFP